MAEVPNERICEARAKAQDRLGAGLDRIERRRDLVITAPSNGM
jgi:hypothetical protein